MDDDASPSAIGRSGPRQFEPQGLNLRRSRLRGATIERTSLAHGTRRVFLIVFAGTVFPAALNCRDAGFSTSSYARS